MKSRYMSRKFIIALFGVIDSLAATYYGNTTIAIAGLILAGCFVIGESIVDASATIKREQIIRINDNKDTTARKENADA